jgi:DNA-binding NtrC family response regulator
MHVETPFAGTLLRSPAAPTSTRPSISSRSSRILVVDDDITTRCQYCALLSHAGYAVDAAADGEQAWKALLSTRYELLLVDDNRPCLCGLDLVARMRAAGLTLPVIINSGCLGLGEPPDDPHFDFVALLHKPFEFTKLMDTVENILQQRSDAERAVHNEAAATNVVPLPLVKVPPSPP